MGRPLVWPARGARWRPPQHVRPSHGQGAQGGGSGCARAARCGRLIVEQRKQPLRGATSARKRRGRQGSVSRVSCVRNVGRIRAHFASARGSEGGMRRLVAKRRGGNGSRYFPPRDRARRVAGVRRRWGKADPALTHLCPLSPSTSRLAALAFLPLTEPLNLLLSKCPLTRQLTLRSVGLHGATQRAAGMWVLDTSIAEPRATLMLVPCLCRRMPKGCLARALPTSGRRQHP